ncbi:MAG: beta-ketoacyl synthase N-terminal-like domain-containing protein [Polyangiaceae bacterium]
MRRTATPIAIVGRSCLLPGASSPAALWELVCAQRSAVAPVPEGRWRIPKDQILTSPEAPRPDHSWSDHGGYVSDAPPPLDVLLGSRTAELMDAFSGLDPLFLWVLHTAREALEPVAKPRGTRVGAAYGILGFPSAGMARFAEQHWLATSGLQAGPVANPRDRFQSGLPMQLLARALDLGAGAFALDAACASSLYAIQFACERLQAGTADLMLAGAANCADDLFIHVGFSALNALSKTGQSRPFHAAADGLVPAEGAGAVALKRLADAERDGDPIYGVIRGVGLSNDGRGRGFLVPSQSGQVRALREAYRLADIDPSQISLLECHATGTPIGDATELAGLSEVFAPGAEQLPLGSLKGNLGHLITAAGVAGLLKLTEALRTETLPPNRSVAEPLSDLGPDSRFRLLQRAEPWRVPAHVSDGLRRAGLSAFGFGGNNAHLVLEEYRRSSPQSAVPQSLPAPEATSIAIVGIGITAAKASGRQAVLEALTSSTPQLSDIDGALQGLANAIPVDIRAAGQPPSDLKHTLAQQLLLEQTAREALAQVAELPRERCGVFVGMGTDPEVSRYGARWRLGTQRTSAGATPDAAWLKDAKQALIGELTSAGVLGTMPNLPANRLNRAFDLGGRSASVCAEELSGLEALDIAARSLADGHLDAALVGAVDLSCEPVHRAAAQALFADSRQIHGDAAVTLVLKRLSDAELAGDRIYAVFNAADASTAGTEFGPDATHSLAPLFGHSHAASGLLHFGAAALCLSAGVQPGGKPWLSDRSAQVTVSSFSGSRWQGTLQAYAPPQPASADQGVRNSAPHSELRLHVFRAETPDALRKQLEQATRGEVVASSNGAVCLVLVADDQATFDKRLKRALQLLAVSPLPARLSLPGIHFRTQPVQGELAYVFTSAGAAYTGMGRDFLSALPSLPTRIAARFPELEACLGWAYEAEPTPTNAQRLWGASALTQLHAEFSLRDLRLAPSAALGYSSGESNSLFAFGVWTDVAAMRQELADSRLFEEHVGGQFRAVASAWGEAHVDWANCTVLAPLASVERYLADEPRLRLAIIHTANVCVISGARDACERLVAHFGAQRCFELEYNLAVHVPELASVRDAWLAVHRRVVTPAPHIRFYSGAAGASYTPSQEACAEAILGHASDQLNFPRLVEAAWRDGVRVFVEHGPGNSCSGWIREVLGDRCKEAVVVALDRRGSGFEHTLDTIAELLAAGVSLNVDAWLAEAPGRFTSPQENVNESPAAVLELPAHPPLVSWPPLSARDVSVAPPTQTVMNTLPEPEPMPPAPSLPSALEWPSVAVATQPTAAPAPTPSGAPLTAHQKPELAPRLPGPQSVLGNLAQLHAGFMQQQAAVHQRFLQARGAMLGALQQVPTAPARPVSPRQPALQPTAPAVLPPPVVVKAPPAAPTTLANTPAPAAQAPTSNAPRGLKLNRQQLEVHASGKISEIYGPLFARQDGYARQVRMPEPPLLLADRVTGIDATPGELGRGTLWSETDVTEDAWYLFRGRMPAGVMIESGQADLMLISYMGADFLNQGERVYRLLGCKLTYFGELPKPGETLCYDIHIDGHAKHGDVRLFFFRYECRVNGELRLRVESGQAGFFTDQELAESAGIVWTAESQEIVQDPRLDAPRAVCTRSSFDASEVRAFAEGRPWECFGPGFERAETHTLTPTIQRPPHLFLDSVPVFDPQGGPWGRGYLRAESPVTPDDWYFAGHFKNDPCMPGTLMFEGCVQALSFYLAAMGYTLDRDAWRFQPVTDAPIDMRCRGQVTPTSGRLSYEVFVEELIAGPEPTIYADVLCSVDGHKAFHARRVGLKLVPDWPMSADSRLLDRFTEPAFPGARPAASVRTEKGDFTFDFRSLLACAWGRPSEAFGPMYARYDGPPDFAPMAVPRLPGPPYHFLTRVVDVQGPIGEPKPGASVVVEYDIPADSWYFDDNGARSMPYCVLLEAALQPCGWLASYVGGALGDSEVMFRNLDGTGTLKAELLDNAGILRSEVKLTKVSRSAGMTLVGFDVQCFLGDRLVYDMTTLFGFFPPDALKNQVGLGVSPADKALLERESNFSADLTSRSGPYYERSARLPGSKLDMLERITGYWPGEGSHGLGTMRGEKRVRSGDWYFKAHFFQDPVQPGSLGIEAMIQLLQLWMLEQGLDAGIPDARFEPIALDQALTWKYRGQVVPHNDTVTTTLEITEQRVENGSALCVANASLWVDGIRIYEAQNLGMRLVSGAPPSSLKAVPTHISAAPSPAGTQSSATPGAITERYSLQATPWLADHCPTYARPALPMMSVVDLLGRAVADAARPLELVRLKDVQLAGWIDFDGDQERVLRTEVTALPDQGKLKAFRVVLLDASQAEAVQLAAAVALAGQRPEAPTALPQLTGEALEDPYAAARLFHGPAFQLLLRATEAPLPAATVGASAVLDAGASTVPRGLLHPALLDAGLHAIPHDRLERWAAVPAGRVGYPARVLQLDVFGPVPQQGEVRCEVRVDGFLLEPDLPRFRLQWIGQGASGEQAVFAEMLLAEACFPQGKLGALPPLERRAFLRDKRYVPGASLSRHTDGDTRLSQAEADASNWMPGTLEHVYGTANAGRIAVHEHVAAREQLHPGLLPDGLPLSRPRVVAGRDGDDYLVRDAEASPVAERLDLSSVRNHWTGALGVNGSWLGSDLWEGLIERFVERVVLTAPEAFYAIAGKPAIYIANHQVQIESLLITNLLSALSGTQVVTMANAKHETRWIGWILRSLFSYPGARDPRAIVYFDQSAPDSMFHILADLKQRLSQGDSFFVHAQGTRAQSCREATSKLSSLFLDLAVEQRLPIVPVRFSGGLPVEPCQGKLEFPHGFGRQDYWVGEPIAPEVLSALPYAARRSHVLDAINGLGPAPHGESPHPPDPNFEGEVRRWMQLSGVDEVRATLLMTLVQRVRRAELARQLGVFDVEEPAPETIALVRAVQTGTLAAPSTASGALSEWLRTLAQELCGNQALQPALLDPMGAV